MKKFLLIIGIAMMLFPSFAKKVVVVEVVKEGAGWQNLFNCYREVTTHLESIENGVPMVSLDCRGAGYNWCRASRNIGELSISPFTIGNDPNVLISNTAIVKAINELIEESELSHQRGTKTATASKKVAINNNNKTDLVLLKATWNYVSTGRNAGAVIRIEIEIDDNNLLPKKRI